MGDVVTSRELCRGRVLARRGLSSPRYTVNQPGILIVRERGPTGPADAARVSARPGRPVGLIEGELSSEMTRGRQGGWCADLNG